jgi:hypothetical protein
MTTFARAVWLDSFCRENVEIRLSHHEQRVGVQKKSDTDLLTTQLKYAKIMLDAKGISDKLYPCISTDSERMEAVMAELGKATESDRKKGMETLVLEWMPADFLDKPKSANTERAQRHIDPSEGLSQNVNRSEKQEKAKRAPEQAPTSGAEIRVNEKLGGNSGKK